MIVTIEISNEEEILARKYARSHGVSISEAYRLIMVNKLEKEYNVILNEYASEDTILFPAMRKAA
jgi:hypothetical protein